MAVKDRQEDLVKQLPIQEQFVFEQARREAAEASRSKAVESLEDFKKNLNKFGIPLMYRYDEEEGDIFYFEIEDTVYSLDFWNKEYNTQRFGKGARRNNKWYSYTNCLSLLDTIKIFFWEYRGIEVLPQIDLVELLNTPLARNMQKARKW